MSLWKNSQPLSEILHHLPRLEDRQLDIVEAQLRAIRQERSELTHVLSTQERVFLIQKTGSTPDTASELTPDQRIELKVRIDPPLRCVIASQFFGIDIDRFDPWAQDRTEMERVFREAGVPDFRWQALPEHWEYISSIINRSRPSGA